MKVYLLWSVNSLYDIEIKDLLEIYLSEEDALHTLGILKTPGKISKFTYSVDYEIEEREAIGGLI